MLVLQRWTDRYWEGSLFSLHAPVLSDEGVHLGADDSEVDDAQQFGDPLTAARIVEHLAGEAVPFLQVSAGADLRPGMSWWARSRRPVSI